MQLNEPKFRRLEKFNYFLRLVRSIVLKIICLACILFGVWGLFFGGQAYIEQNFLTPELMKNANLVTLAQISPASVKLLDLIPLLLSALLILDLVVVFNYKFRFDKFLRWHK